MFYCNWWILRVIQAFRPRAPLGAYVTFKALNCNSLSPPSVAPGIWPWASNSLLSALIFPFGHSQAHQDLVESIKQLYRILVLVLEPMLTTLYTMTTLAGSLTSLNLLRFMTPASFHLFSLKLTRSWGQIVDLVISGHSWFTQQIDAKH